MIADPWAFGAVLRHDKIWKQLSVLIWYTDKWDAWFPDTYSCCKTKRRSWSTLVLCYQNADDWSLWPAVELSCVDVCVGRLCWKRRGDWKQGLCSLKKKWKKNRAVQRSPTNELARWHFRLLSGAFIRSAHLIKPVSMSAPSIHPSILKKFFD